MRWIAFVDRVEEVTEGSDTPRVIAIAPTSAYVPNVALGAAQVAANMKLMADALDLRAACEMVWRAVIRAGSAVRSLDDFLEDGQGLWGINLTLDELTQLKDALARYGDGGGAAEDETDWEWLRRRDKEFCEGYRARITGEEVAE